MSIFAGKRAVFFDAGFTLMEPTREVARVYFESARSLGINLPAQQFETHLARLWQLQETAYRSAEAELASSEEIEQEAWRRLTRDVAAPFPALAERHADWHAMLVRYFDAPTAWQPIPGSHALLGALRSRGFVVAIVSNWHLALHKILKSHAFDRDSAFILTSAEAGRKKPHPEIFQQALRRAEVTAEETIYVGDSWDNDVQGSRSAGLTPVFLSRSPLAFGRDPDVTTVSSLFALCELLGRI